MMQSNAYLLAFIGLSLYCAACSKPSQPAPEPLKLWYLQPANAAAKDDKNGWKDDPEWLKALPLGNGSLGAMVFGDVHLERIQLNEESMWSGSPDDNDNPDAFQALGKIRDLLHQGKYREATALTNQTQICKGAGSGHGNGASVPYGSFQPLGDLWLDFGTSGEWANYHRELNLDQAVNRTSFDLAGVQYIREAFISQPDQVMVMRITADQPGKISFRCRMNRPERYVTVAQTDQLVMSGALSDGKDSVNLQYMARLTAKLKGGTSVYSDSTLTISGADEVILLLAASTDYVLHYPDYKGRNFQEITTKRLAEAGQLTFDQLLQRHLQEYQAYYRRVNLDLPTGQPDTIPTDVRIQQFKTEKNDPHLVELAFQYGRYLLIASSRPGTLPANLQGIWTNKLQTPWNGDYHTDVNIQMNYWPAEVTNLSECHLPYFDLMNTLMEPGAKTARVHYQAKGWVIHPITNIWGYTAPGEAASWGMHVGAGAWMSTHIGEHFYFSQDREFLRGMYPVLQSAVQFYLDWLVRDPVSGKWVSGPAVSPENTFTAPDGSKSQISMGPAHDQQVIWTLFDDYLKVAAVLKIEDSLVQQVQTVQMELAGPQIGPDGRLMEWADTFPEVEPGHRHISHLFALHPGRQINLSQTPEWAAAAHKSLDNRIAHGGGHTGWSAAWLISQYARLRDAEDAKSSLDVVLSKSISPNLFGQHPPFQMDANFGTTAGIAEMLIQSHTGVIELLPALPAAWPDGKVSGLCARGAYVFDLEWKAGKLLSASVLSKAGGTCSVQYQEQRWTLETEKGQSYKVF